LFPDLPPVDGGLHWCRWSLIVNFHLTTY
jgi:hypothetical protein